MDPATGYCEGCLRTLAEIASWSQLSDAERERVMAQLPARGARVPQPAKTPARRDA